MTIIAIIANSTWLVVFAGLTLKEGFPKGEPIELLPLAAFILTFILNLAALLQSPASGSLLALYIRRRMAEEKKRIRELESAD